MPRLRTVSTRDPGWRRIHHGRGYRYLDADGNPLDKADVERIKALVIPPAWRDVWISPYPNAHLLAVGTDDAGRRQYLYHPVWRAKRDEAKFDRVIEMAVKLPAVRRRLRTDLELNGTPGVPRDTALAAAVRLVDLGCFRLGSDSYTEQNGSYGLTTLERRHVRRRNGCCVFSFVGKAGVEHEITVSEPELCQVLDRLTRRRAPEDRVLSIKDGRRWVPLQPVDINEYIRELFGLEVTAKDFRTWHATVHVATSLGEAALGRNPEGRPPASKRARTRAVREAVVSASELLGNTPTVCRSSYVDPRVIDLFESDVTIAPALEKLPADPDDARDHVDEAVVALLTD
jgi:DNA topoisomerase I